MMKKTMKSIFAFTLLVAISASAQTGNVGIGTANPKASAVLDLTSSDKALLLTRVANTSAITSPVNGMIIYDISSNCIKAYENNAWTDCGFMTSPTLLSTTGKTWMNRDLGASQVATSATDYLAYGDLYQWGRNADGHQIINWTSATTGVPAYGTTAIRPDADQAATANFIVINSDNYDWRGTTQNDNLWQGVSGTNNPCPTGFRLPTSTEFAAEITAYGINNLATAFSSPFKFTAQGYRDRVNGNLHLQGYISNYWTSTFEGSKSISYFFDEMMIVNDFSSFRAEGNAIRCIKE